jgi:hypothetical protein
MMKSLVVPRILRACSLALVAAGGSQLTAGVVFNELVGATAGTGSTEWMRAWYLVQVLVGGTSLLGGVFINYAGTWLGERWVQPAIRGVSVLGLSVCACLASRFGRFIVADPLFYGLAAITSAAWLISTSASFWRRSPNPRETLASE